MENYLDSKWLGLASANVLPTTTALSIASSATVDLNGINQQVASLADYAAGSQGAVINSSTAAAMLTLNAAGGATTFSGAIQGGGGAPPGSGTITLFMAGGGVQVLAGSNTYTGPTTVSGGTLQLGTGAGGQDGSINGTSSLTDNAALVYNLAGSQTEAYSIGGNGSLTKLGPGTLTLSASNGYSGRTTVAAGTLQLGNSAALGTGALAADGGTLDLAGYSILVPSFSGASGTVTNNGGALATLTVSQSINTSFNGTLQDGAGTLALYKTGPGLLALSGTNAYSGGTTLNSGTLNINGDAALGNAAGGVTFSGNSTLQAGANNITLSLARGLTIDNGVTATIDARANTLTIAGAISGSGRLVATGGTLALYGTSTLAGTYAYATANASLLQINGSLTVPDLYVNGQLAGSGTITTTGGDGLQYQSTAASTFGGTIAGTRQLEISNGGALTLAGANTYQGNTLVDTGGNLLRMGAANALPYGAGKGYVEVDSGGTLDLAGNTANINGLTSNGIVDNLAAGSATLVVGNNNATSTFSGVIQSSSGALALQKVGSGTLTLSGPNTYSGATTVNGGVLAVGASNTLSPYSDHFVGTNSTAGTLDVSGFSGQQVKSLTVGNYGLVNMSSSYSLAVLGNVTLASSSAINIAGVITLPDLLMTYTGSESGTFLSITNNGLALASGDASLYSGGSIEVVSLPIGPSIWSGASGANWSGSNNWSGGPVPSGSGAGAVFSASTSGSLTVTLDSAETVGTLAFGTSGSTGFLLTGSNLLTLNNSGSAASIAVVSGTHSIATPLEMAGGNLVVSASNGGELVLSGSIADDFAVSNVARCLILEGDGTGQLVLSGTGSYSGGTYVDAGTLIVNNSSAIPDGTSLTVGAGGVFVFDPTVTGSSMMESSHVGAVAPVPEPGTIVLLLAALWSAAGHHVLRGRRRFRPKAFGGRS